MVCPLPAALTAKPEGGGAVVACRFLLVLLVFKADVRGAASFHRGSVVAHAAAISRH